MDIKRFCSLNKCNLLKGMFYSKINQNFIDTSNMNSKDLEELSNDSKEEIFET